MATQWPADEAFANPDIWLGSTAHIHCLQRIVLLPGTPSATRLLLSLKGSNVSRERQLVALFGKHPVADKVRDAVPLASDGLATRNAVPHSNTVVAS